MSIWALSNEKLLMRIWAIVTFLLPTCWVSSFINLITCCLENYMNAISSVFCPVGCLDHLSIHSNEFSYEGSLCSGEILRNIESPWDKVKQFKSILTSLSSTAKSGHKSVYIGDSVGDLLCLLLADIGIVVGSSASLRKVGESFGVSFVPLLPGVVEKQRQLDKDKLPIWNGLSGVLYTVSSWSEIHAFILGP
jgi:thiamine phosphate phosphatase / amino-HMP aminohydrolase